MATDEQIQKCRDKGFMAYGTAYIFEKRFLKAQRKINWLTFSGIALPISVGGIVVAFFGLESLKPYLSGLIVLAALLSTIQLIFSIWSLIAKWNDEAVYASESNTGNSELSTLYEELATNNPKDFDTQYKFLNLRNDLRSQTDSRKGITEPEKRMGMKAALRKYQRECAGCKQVPKDLKSSDCSVCGSY
jgi:mobilome CxxCx(11)CxxC protein